MKRIKSALSLLLAIVMIVSIVLPVGAFAAETTDVDIAIVKVETGVYKLTYTANSTASVDEAGLVMSFDNSVLSLAAITTGMGEDEEGNSVEKYAQYAAIASNDSNNQSNSDIKYAMSKIASDKYTSAIATYVADSRTAINCGVTCANAQGFIMTNRVLFEICFRLKEGKTEADLNKASFKIETETGDGTFLKRATRDYGVIIKLADGTIYGNGSPTNDLPVTFTFPGDINDALTGVTINDVPQGGFNVAAPTKAAYEADGGQHPATLQLKATPQGLNGAYTGTTAATTTWSLVKDTQGAAYDEPPAGVSIASDTGLLSVTNEALAGETFVMASTTVGGMTKKHVAPVNITRADPVLTSVKFDNDATSVELGGSLDELVIANACDQYGSPFDADEQGDNFAWSIEDKSGNAVPNTTATIEEYDDTSAKVTVVKNAPECVIVVKAVYKQGQSDSITCTADITITRADAVLTSVSLDKASIAVVGGDAADQTVTPTAKDQFSDAISSGVIWSLVDNTDDKVTIDTDTGVVTVKNKAKAATVTVQAANGDVTKTATFAITRSETLTATELKLTCDETGADTDVIVPASGSANPGALYTATVYDQYGDEISPAPDITWEVTAKDGNTTFTGVTVYQTGITNAPAVETTAKGYVTNATGKTFVITATVKDTEIKDTAEFLVKRAAQKVTAVEVSGDDTEFVIPANGVTTSDTADFTAAIKDQYGDSILTQSVTWHVSTVSDNIVEPDSGISVGIANGKVSVSNDAKELVTSTDGTASSFYVFAVAAGNVRSAAKAITIKRDTQAATEVKIFRSTDTQFATPITADTIIIPTSDTANTATYVARTYDQYDTYMSDDTPTLAFATAVEGKVTHSDGTVTVTKTADKNTTYTLTATSQTGGKTKELTISVKDIAITWPDVTLKTSPTYGDTWGEIVGISGGSASLNSVAVPGAFTVKNSDAVPGVKDAAYVLNFTSTDGKYNIDKDPVSVSIAKATPTIDDLDFDENTIPTGDVYNGSAQGIGEIAAKATEASIGKVVVRYKGTGGIADPAITIEPSVDGALNTYTQYSPTDAGTYEVTAVIAGGDNYKAVGDQSKAASGGIDLGTYTIAQADITGFDSPAPTPELDAFTAYETNKLTDLEAVKAVGDDTSLFPDTWGITYGESNDTADVNMEWTYKSGTYDAKGANYTFTGTPDLTTGNGLNFTTGDVTIDVRFVVSPITGTPTWTVTSLTKAKSEVKDITDYSDIAGLPTTVAVAYDPDSTGAGATKTYDIDGWSVTYTTIRNSAPTDTTNVVYTDMTPTIKWPAWLTLAESPELKTTLTVTNKYPVTVTLPDQIGREYNKTLFTVTPASAVDNGHGLGDNATRITYSYFGKAYAVGDTTEATGAAYGPIATAPTNAGIYTVTATYENATHYGVSETKTFTIEQKEVIIAFNAAGITSPGDHSKYPYYTYDNTPHGPTATVAVGYLETDDDCTVTLEYIGKAYLASDASVDVANGAAYTDGVAPKNAGVYRAQVSETSLSNPNYTPAIVAYVYAIAKADRGTLSVTDKTGNTVDTTSKLLLYPTQLTDTLVPSVTSNLDKDATFTFVSGNTATVTVNNAGLVTAVANDPGVTVTVTCPATGNYNEKIANVTVVSAPQPITELNVRSSGPGDALTASVNDEKQTITVTGFITEGATLDVVYESIASSGQPATLPISGGTRVPILISSSNPRVGIYYNVDTSGVTILPAGVTITKGTMEPPDTSAIEDDDDRAAVETALAGADVNGLGAAASEAIIAKAKALSEANSGHAIEAQVYLSIKAVEYNAGEKFFTIDITPMVKYVDKGDGDKVLATDPIPDSAVKSPVTITINTPGWYVANDKIFVDHRNVTVAATTAGGKTSWTQDSFSPSTLFVNNLRGRIEYTFEDKTVQTISYNAIDLGKSLPTDSKPGYNFNGWDISIKDPKATGALTIVEKSQTTMTPKLLGEVCSSLSGVTAKPTFTPAGGGMTSYTITAEAGENGRLEPFGRVSVSAGGSKTFTITPDEGYVVDKLTVDGKSVEAANTYTFQDVGADHTISVTFKKAVDKFFEDVAKTDWFYDDVYAVYEKGLMDGVSDEPMLFDPAGITNRAMAVTVLWRLAGEPEPSGNMPFTDVPADQWYTKAISWAADLKVVDGVTPTTFEPLTSVTREQLAALLYRYALYFAKTADPADATGDLSAFADGGEVSGWAVEPMRWCVAKGLIEGRTGTKELDPLGFAQRSELAALLNRFASKIG